MSKSGIDFSKLIGGADQEKPTDRAKAKLWLNLGYESNVIEEDTGKKRFVALPLGIPVDTQEKLPVNSRNADFANFQSARNALLDQIIAVGNALKPGESRLVNLTVQLRRVGEEITDNSAPADENPFVVKLDL